SVGDNIFFKGELTKVLVQNLRRGEILNVLNNLEMHGRGGFLVGRGRVYYGM
ncbi:hypothetical protein A2U01_0082419, partial [Trifolium medium]|nr:hypothetical protein [Trifolium medium]